MLEKSSNRVRSIVLNNLHGLYSYSIDIPEDQPVFIITGPNGYGKTTILSILQHLYKADFWFFYYLVFSDMTISFNDGHEFVLTKVLVTDSNSMMDAGAFDSSYVRVDFKEGENTVESFQVNHEYVSDLVKQSQRPFPWEEDDREQEVVLNDQYNLQNDVFLQNSGRNSLLFISSLQSVFVSARRLEKKEKRDFMGGDNQSNTIEEISYSIVSDFTKAQSEFAEISQKTDASFIGRLIDAQANECDEDENSLKSSIERVKSRIAEYRKYQLVPDVQLLDSIPLGDRGTQVLSLYLRDMETKMNALAPYYEKLNAFSSFVSKCVLSDKEMTLGPQGIKIFNIKGEQIRLDLLSDGEQDLIILAFYLTYFSGPHTLLLIDQPEDSLHMSWLENLLEGFIDAASVIKNQIITATHSPAFISGHWDLTYDLFENNLSK